ncbi:Zinc finger C2H2-type protein [Macrophomina phaseolina MS6]|uniref:Zinc finger C2H2-type protein n=2 Tax=Macrophomina phaseolina TaxID=35725 RepID=K2SMV2_MACPH|nr:Zinc finger C2H2-type protein [Macrophomina phaseolina MS6]
MTLPPTPPMRPDSVIDGNQSPSTSSQSSVPQQTPYYLGQSLNNMEPHQQRQQMPPTAPMRQRPSVPSQPATSPYTTSPYAPSPYGSSPGGASVGSYYSPENQVYTSPSMYGQRPLPSNFPPPPVPVSVPVSAPGNPNPWQHHHYISASSAAAFPQSQDRYICQTCNKAFSRPSSLRIHSHSHTGEKPFKCPHAGCGKAFSVRSNMKRHERGCHATAGPSVHGS